MTWRDRPDLHATHIGRAILAAPDERASLEIAAQIAQDGQDGLAWAIDRVRRAGWTWQQVGDFLGVSRQAAQQRFGR